MTVRIVRDVRSLAALTYNNKKYQAASNAAAEKGADAARRMIIAEAYDTGGLYDGVHVIEATNDSPAGVAVGNPDKPGQATVINFGLEGYEAVPFMEAAADAIEAEGLERRAVR